MTPVIWKLSLFSNDLYIMRRTRRPAEDTYCRSEQSTAMAVISAKSGAVDDETGKPARKRRISLFLLFFQEARDFSRE